MGTITTVNKQNYIKCFGALRSELSQANIHFKIWKALSEATDEYNNEMNRATVFFSATINAHLKTAINHSYKLIDEHSDALNIYKVLDFLESNLDIFSPKKFSRRVRDRENSQELIANYVQLTSNDIRELRRKLRPIKSLRKRLTLWRNKQEAHIDIEELSANTLESLPIQITEFEKLISICACVLDHLSSAYNGTTRSLNVIGEDDWRNVLEALRRNW